MTPKIRILDQNTANQIAAGEVVEKPASVVKELVENALDAGAVFIEIAIYEGGTEYIRVTDNGSGMSETDAKAAVLRHATSKIDSAEDLLRLSTLGFRGEALPSIASVAKFNLLTRTPDEEMAISLTIEGGKLLDCLPAGGSIGTTVTVEDLFYNVPARRKFLKTTGTEGRYIGDVVGKLALSRPDVRFLLTSNDKTVLHTTGSGKLAEAVSALYGKKVADELLGVSYENSGIKVEGYVGKPTLLKGSRQWQTLFINGRAVNNRMVSKAIDHAYQAQIPKAGFPFAVIDISLDPAAIDVNVHPQKSEVKFSDEGLVYRTVYHALVNALSKPLSAAEASHGFQAEKADDRGLLGAAGRFKGYGSEQQEIWKTQPQTFGQASISAFGTLGVAESRKIYLARPLQEVQETLEQQDKLSNATPIELTGTDEGVDIVWPLGQINRLFIVAQSENDLFLIDQHAAHERVLYDKLVRKQDNIPSQQFLVPLFLDLTPQEISLLEEHRKTFLELGVDAEAAGETTLRISSLPADVRDSEAEGFIGDILTMLGEMKNIAPQDLRRKVLYFTACHGAIKAGEIMNMRQMKNLILDLFNTEHPFTCPHGRPCMVQITSEELYKMFKRT